MPCTETQHITSARLSTEVAAPSCNSRPLQATLQGPNLSGAGPLQTLSLYPSQPTAAASPLSLQQCTTCSIVLCSSRDTVASCMYRPRTGCSNYCSTGQPGNRCKHTAAQASLAQEALLPAKKSDTPLQTAQHSRYNRQQAQLPQLLPINNREHRVLLRATATVYSLTQPLVQLFTSASLLHNKEQPRLLLAEAPLSCEVLSVACTVLTLPRCCCGYSTPTPAGHHTESQGSLPPAQTLLTEPLPPN